MENPDNGKTALVLGYGRSGKAAEALLCRAGFSVTVLDGESVFPTGDFAVAVVSPGIAIAHPWVVEAKRRGIPLKSELQLGCEELKRQGWKLLAVTGSKGKSSVVKLVADALGGAACGNYGRPVCDVAIGEDARRGAEDAATPWAVVEVSSFQLETTNLPPDTFEAAAILNLQEDHLDRHGSVEVYHGLKRKLLGFAKRRFVGGEEKTDEPLCCNLFAGSYFDNPILSDNAAIAVALMRVAGLDDGAIAKTFRDFEPLPHRMNTVAEIDGVRYVDDSKATSLAALAAGVEMAFALHQSSIANRQLSTVDGQSPITRHQAQGTRNQSPDASRQKPETRNQEPGTRNQSPILLIAGGLPKGDEPISVISTLTKRVKKVYLIGQCAEVFAKAWKASVDCEICGTMERAVASAKRDAERGDVVLLSPGTASFDQFKSFGERGEVFAGLVKKGKKRMNKLGMVLGIAAVATLAGCKDPDYVYDDGSSAQNEVKSAESQPEVTEVKPIAIEAAPVAKCTCLPGTKHTSPCTCGAPDCKCIVEAPIVIKADVSKPAKPAAAAVGAEYTTYVVQKGDVLSKIAKKYNLKVADVRNANPKIKKDVIWVGMKLRIPGKVNVGTQASASAAISSAAKKPAAAYTGATKEYVVKSGDTLGSIAYGNGINIRQLKSMNGLTKDMIRVGQKLKVPANKVSAPAKANAKPVAKKIEKKVEKKIVKKVEKKADPVTAEAPVAAVTEPAPEASAPAAAPAADPAPAAEPAPAAADAAAPAPAAAPAAASTATYIVQEGDDMTGVSIRWGVSAAAIRELNNLPDDAQLVPGQILKLPADAQQ